MFFDDMWTKSHYSLGSLCQALPREPLAIGSAVLSPEQQRQDAEWLAQHLASFHTTAAILDGCGLHASLLRADELAGFGFPSLSEDEYGYSHQYPPVISVRAQGEEPATVER